MVHPATPIHHRRLSTPEERRAAFAAIPGVVYPKQKPAAAPDLAEYVTADKAAGILKCDSKKLIHYTKSVARIRCNGKIAYLVDDLVETTRYKTLQNGTERPADTITETEAAAKYGITRTTIRRRLEAAGLTFIYWPSPGGQRLKLYSAQAVSALFET